MYLKLSEWKFSQKYIARYLKSNDKEMIRIWIKMMIGRKGYDKAQIDNLIIVTKKKIILGIL